MKNYYRLLFAIHVRIFIFIPFLCLIISTTSKCTSNKSKIKLLLRNIEGRRNNKKQTAQIDMHNKN